MDVSIIIPSFNTREVTIRCIKSIDNDKSDLVKEIIVVDNASSDGTADALDLIKLNRTKLTVVRNDENVGFAKACNKGIRRSLGKYILLLNSDTEIVSGAIDKMVDYADGESKLGILGPKLLNPDGSVQASCFRLPTVFRAIWQYWIGRDAVLDKYYPKGETPEAVECLVGAAMLITPACIKKVGLFNERYFMYFEDLDYCRKVNRSGLKIIYLPSAKVIHSHGESGKNLESEDNQWRRLIPSSKIYHGLFNHVIINAIIWSGMKFRK